MEEKQQQPVAAKVDAAPGVTAQQETKPVELTGGVPNGFVNKTDPSVPEPIRERIDHTEAVVHEQDKEGNVIGWHKEPAGA